MKNTNTSVSEDKILFSRILDAIRLCETKNEMRFLGFLDQRQREVVQHLAQKQSSVPYLFWGGYELAERTMIGFFPLYLTPDVSAFHLQRLDFTFRAEDKLSHRDFLGTLLSLGIKRETLGDQLVTDGRCSIFLCNEIAEYVVSSLIKVGGVGVTRVENDDWQLPSDHKFQELSDTIASPRLDCVIATLVNKSRTLATQMINAGNINVNFSTIKNIDFQIKQNDIISIRNYGRFKIEAIGPLTRKGRLSFKAKKYL